MVQNQAAETGLQDESQMPSGPADKGRLSFFTVRARRVENVAPTVFFTFANFFCRFSVRPMLLFIVRVSRRSYN